MLLILLHCKIDLKLIIPLQEEALQAFIQPETLDGPNQYFCERCKKKCDARKVSAATAGRGGEGNRESRSATTTFRSFVSLCPRRV